MIRDLAKALVGLALFLISIAEVQRAEDAAIDQFEQQRGTYQ